MIGDARESAIIRTLNPGAYTAVMRGKGNGVGIGVIEAYDLNATNNSKLARAENLFSKYAAAMVSS